MIYYLPSRQGPFPHAATRSAPTRDGKSLISCACCRIKEIQPSQIKYIIWHIGSGGDMKKCNEANTRYQGNISKHISQELYPD